MLDSGDAKNGYPNTFIGQSGIGYKICDRLGAGSASIVFRCYSVGKMSEDGIMIPVKEKYYAVKIIYMKSLYLSPDYKEKKGRLLEEVVILQKLRHPNIVSLVDYSDSGEVFFLVMDLVEGGELFYKIVESGSLAESSARYIMKQVVDSLIYMHRKDIIHRDLKPENILINKVYPGNYFDIKVADFGVAKFLGHGFTQARTLVGTPQYWAPEVIYASKTGDSYGPEVDLWSLGVLLYVMLGGAFPFDERKGNLEHLIREGNYHFRYPRFKDVSDQAKKLIQRLLTVNPKERMTLEELVNCPWMNIKDENAPIKVSLSVDGNNDEIMDEYGYDKEESMIYNGKIDYSKTSENSDTLSFEVERCKDDDKDSKVGLNYGSDVTIGIETRLGVSNNLRNNTNNTKTSSIMDLNGLLDLQLSVAYKLHGIYIAFRHNSTICRVLKQHIHKWRILQQQSCLTIGRFKQTCESVLDELPDFLLAVNTNEPKLAIELLSNVKQMVDITQKDVETIQNGYNDFLFELSIFVESIRDIKRISELSNNGNLFLKNETGISAGGLLFSGGCNALSNVSSPMKLFPDHNSNREKPIESYDVSASKELLSNPVIISELGLVRKRENSKEDVSVGETNFNEVKEKGGSDPSIFIGYNSARERVIRRITDLFSNTEITSLFYPTQFYLLECGNEGVVTEQVKSSSFVNDDISGLVGEKPNNAIEIGDHYAKHEWKNNEGPKEKELSENDKIIKAGVGRGLDSTFITTSLASTRDLFLDFLFLPASICNVPPSGVESLLEESIDFGVPNINGLETPQEKSSEEFSLDTDAESKETFDGVIENVEQTPNSSLINFNRHIESEITSSEIWDQKKEENKSSGGKVERPVGQDNCSSILSRNNDTHCLPVSSPSSISFLPPDSSSSLQLTSPKHIVNTYTHNHHPPSSNLPSNTDNVTNPLFASVSISPLRRNKKNENKLKISYILVRVLAQLRMIETILGRCVAFWGNMNIMIDKILQLRQNAEKLLGFTGNPVLRNRFDERVESYRLFWKELRDICDSYLTSVNDKQSILEKQVHELLDTASKVDTVFNMNFIELHTKK